MVTADGVRLDLASIYARMAPGERSEVAVFVTGRSKGQGRKPRRLFPARLIILRQHAASDRAVRPPNASTAKSGLVWALQPMTLASARFLMVLTSLPADLATAPAVLAAYRLRWQVELAFKQLKIGLGIDRLLARDPARARSWLLSHLSWLCSSRTAQAKSSTLPPVRNVGQAHPVSVWRLQAILRLALLGAILSPSMTGKFEQGIGSITRRICDSPPRRPYQSALARSRIPLAPSPPHR
jgi:hypothetical protein